MPQSDWRQLDWSILTTIALVGPFEPEMMCHAHSKGVRLVFGWDPGAFCPGPNGNNWMTKAMNATPEQIRACIPSPNDWFNETLADLWVTESVRYLQSIHVDGVNFDTEYCCKDALSNHGQTYLFRKLTAALHASIPGSKVSVTTASLHLGLAPHDPTYLPLADAVDYLVPMEYDSGASLYGGHSTPSGYKGGYYTACAQVSETH